MLEVSGISVSYGPFLALNDVSVSIGAGEIVGLIGANGAGKTSLVRCLGGMVKPTRGTIRFQAKPIDDCPVHDRIRLGMSIVPEGRGLFPQMSVEENLLMGGYPIGNAARVRENMERCCALFPILRERRHQRGGTLSGGQQQMLAISMGLMADPKLLILDEPSLGLAPIVIGEIGRCLTEFKKIGLTVLLVEQNAQLACDVADRVYVMQTGSIRYHDTPDVLFRNPEVAESFLSI